MRASLLAVGLLAATPALAADIRQGTVLTVPAGEVVRDDLYLAGSEIHVLGTVDGDLVVAGSAIVVSGVVNGDVIAAGSSDGFIEIPPGATGRGPWPFYTWSLSGL